MSFWLSSYVADAFPLMKSFIPLSLQTIVSPFARSSDISPEIPHFWKYEHKSLSDVRRSDSSISPVEPFFAMVTVTSLSGNKRLSLS